MLKTAELTVLEAARDELAAALDEETRTKAALGALQADFDRQHAALIAQKEAAAERVKELRVVVGDKAVKAWEIEQTAKLTDGIGMQQRTQVDYDPLALREALIKYAPMFLMVDKDAIKALGESAANKNPLFAALMPVLPIKIYDKPTPTIGDETLLKLHQMNEAGRVVEAAMNAVPVNPVTPKPATKRRQPDPVEANAVDTAAAALDLVGTL
jgi:hypothetical protein